MLPQISQQETADERDRLRLLLDVTNAVVSNLSLKELLLAVSECLRRFFAHDWASLVIRDEESGQLRIHALNAPAPGGVLEEGSILPLDERRLELRSPRVRPVSRPYRLQRVLFANHSRSLQRWSSQGPRLLEDTLRNRMKKLGLR